MPIEVFSAAGTEPYTANQKGKKKSLLQWGLLIIIN